MRRAERLGQWALGTAVDNVDVQRAQSGDAQRVSATVCGRRDHDAAQLGNDVVGGLTKRERAPRAAATGPARKVGARSTSRAAPVVAATERLGKL